jgi:hypothetical protein
MRKLLFFFICIAVFYSCKKENIQPVSQEVTTGFLRFSDPAYDGLGLYYDTDSAETIIIKDDTANLISRDPKYSDFVNIHSRLTFTDSSERGCLSGMAPGPCAHMLRKVRVNKLEKLQ